LTKYFDIGDYVMAKIINVTSQKLVDVTMKGPGLRKLKGGRIIQVNPYKVPRIIGKAGSMVTMIKDATGCRILVGQNGLVWIILGGHHACGEKHRANRKHPCNKTQYQHKSS